MLVVAHARPDQGITRIKLFWRPSRAPADARDEAASTAASTVLISACSVCTGGLNGFTEPTYPNHDKIGVSECVAIWHWSFDIFLLNKIAALQ